MLEIIGNIFNNIYIMLFIAILYFLLSKLNVDKRNIDRKISILNTFLFILMFTDVNMIIIYFLYLASTFMYLEIITLEKFEKELIKEPKFLLLDYLYKMIINYGALYMFFSYLFYKCFKLPFILKLLISFYLAFKGIIASLNNDFETYSFNEIYEKVNLVMKFNKFNINYKLEMFSNMLLYKEDKSYFIRENSYNLLSLEFLYYRLKRCYDNYKYNSKLSKFRKIILLFRDVCIHTFRFIYINVKKLFKYFYFKIRNKFSFKKKYIKLTRGYSTIEMQLIRTLAVKDGYNKYPIKRKIFELIYSYIFFNCLNEYYRYIGYMSYFDDNSKFKYYLIYLYIYFAPVKINGKMYNNIFELYNKESLYDISYEEFFVWTLGLSFKPIDYDIIGYKTVEWAGLDKKELLLIVDKFQN